MKSLINITLLKEQLRRFWAIGAVSMLAYILAVVMVLFMDSGRDQTSQGRFMLDILSMRHPILIAMLAIIPFCVVMALYPYHFSGRATTTFYTFPITKRQLFWTNFATGTILLLLPLLVLCIMLLVPIHYTPSQHIPWGALTAEPSHFNFPLALFPNAPLEVGSVINTIPRVTGFFVRMAIGFMFYFGMFKLAVSVSGNRVISVLLCGALPLVPMAVHGLIWAIGNVYVFGLSSAIVANHVSATASLTNPLAWLDIINGNNPIIRDFVANGLRWVYVLYIAIAVAMFVIAHVCSCIRKHERTGDSVVFTTLKNVLVFVLSMLGMIAMGLFLMAIFQSRFMLYVGYIFGFVIAYFIAQMIAEKALNVLHKVKSLLPFGATMLGLYIAMLLITGFGMGFYTNRVPAQTNIAAISIQQWNTRPTFIDNDVIIARTIEVHNQILNNRSYLRRVHWNSITGVRWQHSQIHVSYLLHDGTEIHRTYRASHDFMERSGANSLLAEPLVLLSRHQVLLMPEVVDSIAVNIWPQDSRSASRGIHFSIPDIRGAEAIASLIEAIKTDYIREAERNLGILHRNGMAQAHSDAEDNEAFYHISFNFSLNANANRVIGWHISRWISLSTTRDGAVMQWLEDRGYLIEIEVPGAAAW